MMNWTGTGDTDEFCSHDLMKELPEMKGFSYSALTRMVQFNEVFPDPEIIATLSQTFDTQIRKGVSYSFLSRMVLFCEAFPEQEIIATLSQQLS